MTDFDFDSFLALPRLSGLRLSPDGRRLVVAVGGPDPEGKRMRSALWQVDPAGVAAPASPDPLGGRRGRRRGVPARRLAPLHLEPARPGREARPGPEGPRPLAAARRAAARRDSSPLPEGGVDGLATARDAAVVAFGAGMFPGAADFAADAERGKARKEAGVEALLFENDYPVRHWDHWLGAAPPPPLRRAPSPTTRRRRSRRRGTSSRTSPTLTFEETGIGLAPDGRFLVASRNDAAELPGILDGPGRGRPRDRGAARR